jgi:hypothetical protein
VNGLRDILGGSLLRYRCSRNKARPVTQTRHVQVAGDRCRPRVKVVRVSEHHRMFERPRRNLLDDVIDVLSLSAGGQQGS